MTVGDPSRLFILCSPILSLRNMLFFFWTKCIIKHVFCTSSANIFYQPPPSLPWHRERWRRRRKRHQNNKQKGCYQACSPRLPAHLWSAQVERCRRELPPPYNPTLLNNFVTAAVDLEDGSNLEVVSMTAEIRQQQWLCTNFRLSDRTLISWVGNFVIWQKSVEF